MSLGRAVVHPGRPYPLGATWDGAGVNFALFTAHGERVQLCLFDPTGDHETDRIDLPECTDEVWHGYLPEARPGLLYGYRVEGPYDPARGHRFNSNKLLLDPYAKSLVGSFRWSDAHFGYRVGAAKADLTFDRRDNARGMPKCRIIDPAFTWGAERRPAVPWAETVIYEAHVRGMTMRHPEVPGSLRGTYGGLGSKPVVDHLRSLGVTAVELLPVHACVDDRHLVAQGLHNYWGYNSVGFFAPDPRYMSGSSTREFKTMVTRLHDAGIEVILDVVYNHTGEGSHLGPTLCFRGIDNASYYLLTPGDRRYYVDHTGCGNTLNASHPRVLQMIMDSLRYWVTEMRVDGFRFDLATALAREAGGFDPSGSFLDAVRQDPVLQSVKLIAEPWDLGPGGYQVGSFPPGWAEWNDKFRDTVRRFWRGDDGMLPDLAARLAGSADLFDHGRRRSWASVNFVTSHDGFTLADLVSYAHKRNEANGEGNRDGHDANFSTNHGVEGPTTDPVILERREGHARALMATLLLAQGTPMLLGGDELLRTQGGNNNAYAQDNEVSWLDWSLAGRRDMLAFVRYVLALRRQYPALRQDRFLHGRETTDNGLRDLLWIHPTGVEMAPDHWRDAGARCVGLLLTGPPPRVRVSPDFLGGPGTTQKSVLLLIANSDAAPVPFTLPTVPDGRGWRWLLDSAQPTGEPVQAGALLAGDGTGSGTLPVPGRTVLVFEAVRGDVVDGKPRPEVGGGGPH